MGNLKLQKFHLSTVISFVFFTVFITLLFSSAFWFYNSTVKSIQNETNNYFKQNKKIVEIILDSYANNLSDLTRQISNQYSFEDSHVNDGKTKTYLENMLESNIDNRLDFMFVHFYDGQTIDVSLTIFSSENIIKNLLLKKIANGVFFEKIKSDDNDLAVLVSKHEIIDSISGRYLGDLYAGIILNDSFPIVDEIQSKLEIESLSFIVNDKIISSSTTYDAKEFERIEDFVKHNNSTTLEIYDNHIFKRDIVKIRNKNTDLEIVTIVEDTTFDKFEDEFIQKISILGIFVIVLFLISYKMITRIIELPLNKLLTFASSS
ncbi:MAG: hypothetical protein HRT43_08160, partial [Campylobacteraceae bacterium]|nr:hypothetical protein [Campylobacteraceae bacterium]